MEDYTIINSLAQFIVLIAILIISPMLTFIIYSKSKDYLQNNNLKMNNMKPIRNLSINFQVNTKGWVLPLGLSRINNNIYIGVLCFYVILNWNNN
jgi:cbb3-type cytochrome oxidase subunit 3